MSNLLGIDVKQLPDAILLHVEGEVDIGTAPELREAMIAAIASGRHVIVNVRDVEYIDMAGFHVLQTGQQSVAGDQRFAIIASTPHVDRIIEIIQFRNVVPVLDSEGAALDFVRARHRSDENKMEMP